MGSLLGPAVVVETSPAETGLSGSHGALGTPWGLLLLGHQYDEPQGPHAEPGTRTAEAGVLAEKVLGPWAATTTWVLHCQVTRKGVSFPTWEEWLQIGRPHLGKAHGQVFWARGFTVL